MVAIQGESRFIQREERRGVSFILALSVHLLLALFLLFSVQWRTQKIETVEVELWGAPPPPVLESQPKVAPVEVIPPAPPLVVPPLPAEVPDIVEEKVKPSAIPATEKPKAMATPKATITPAPTQAPLPTKKAQEPSAVSLEDIFKQGMAERNKVIPKTKAPVNNAKPADNHSNTTEAATGTAAQGPGNGQSRDAQPGKDYENLVGRLIRSKLDYHESKGDNAKAKIKMVLMPDGTIVSADVMKQIGNPVFAEAARRAALSTQRLPARPDGKLFTGDSRVWVMNFCADETATECKID